jgi:hypothetical protein
MILCCRISMFRGIAIKGFSARPPSVDVIYAALGLRMAACGTPLSERLDYEENHTRL